MWFVKSRRAQNPDDFETRIEGGVMPTLNSFDNGDVRAVAPIVNAEEEQMQTVRRLTPTECERLQGFPDGWTDGQADSHRYKQMGNAVTVNVAQAVGQFIMEAEQSGQTPNSTSP